MEADTFIDFVGPPPSPYPLPPADPTDPGVRPVLVTTDTEWNPPITGLVVGVSGALRAAEPRRGLSRGSTASTTA
ncbi:MAG: hypothetical protein IPK07_07830 [Deltaproteobacteria bacterium]|nr:hypothetical protein [Deltaproteobacteria bacterium]